jgi:mercuric ion binding protein
VNPTPAAAHYRPSSILTRIARLVAVTIATLMTVAAAPSAAAEATTDTTTLRVEGMYCSGCEATVRSVLTGLDGVSEAQADNDTQTATVTYDPARVTPRQMVQAINNSTYYQASLSDGSSPAAPSAAPPHNGGSIAIWATVAALAAALATSVVFVRRVKHGRSTEPTQV